nr:hypothetical protein [Bdellovibrionales bacterium]
EVDQRMTDLKHEMKALDEQRAFLTRFIQTFAFSATNRSPANEAFHELPEEVQEVLKEVEAQIGRSLVDFKQPSADSLEALYDGEVLVQTGRGGRPIVPENIADAFYEINGALGGVSAIKTIVIAAGADFEPQKTRIKRFVKDYLGHSGAQGIEIREVPADEGIKLSVEMFPVLFGSRSRH